LGGGLVRILCLRQTDAKVIIAYSSVAHIGLAIAASFINLQISLIGVYLILIAHGLVSSGIFAAANTIYEQVRTRNLLLSKGLLSYIPLFSLF